MGPSYPIFMCPNCRAATDLDADVEEPPEEWQQLDSGVEDVHENAELSASPDAIMEDSNDNNASTAQSGSPMAVEAPSAVEEAGDVTMRFDRQSPPRNLSSPPLPIPGIGSFRPPHAGSLRGDGAGRRTPSPNSASLAVVTEGPLTPRNDAGPWVFDGNPARASQDVPRPNAMSSLDAAASERQG